eukprot:gnl/Chilomastix_caulleri/1797.p1 GENE.gnl/Chilomastix_caulleri/1797~~gnl/Chilomastix_caulleri/1797.p1  ORF type:complete len:145 (+),score=32.46 gnl/Chilomastix_caulleri/1797:740-1174(+)
MMGYDDMGLSSWYKDGSGNVINDYCSWPGIRCFGEDIELEFSYSGVFVAFPGPFTCVQNIISVSFSHTLVPSISPNLCLLKNLENINFSSTGAVSIPSCLCGLTKLLTINVMDDDIVKPISVCFFGSNEKVIIAGSSGEEEEYC